MQTPDRNSVNQSPIEPQSFDDWQLADFEEVKKLVALIDPIGEHDILHLAWRQAQSLIYDDAIWEALEFFAALLQGSSLDGALVDYLCPEIFAGLEGFDAEAGITADRRPSRSLS